MSFACVLCRLFAFLLLFLKISLSILISWTLLNVWFANIISLSLVCLLIFSIRSLDPSQFGFSLLCSSVQSFSHVQLFTTPWIAARQATLSITNSRGFIQSCVHRVGDAIQPSHPGSSPFPSAPNPLPASASFPMSQLFTWGGQSTGVSTLASFLPKKAKGWSPSEWTGYISLQSKGLSRVFSNTTFQKHQFFSAQLSL